MRCTKSLVLSAAAVAKLSLTIPPAGRRTCTRKPATGSSPLIGEPSASSAWRCMAGCPAVRLRPRKVRRSAMKSTAPTRASESARKCATTMAGSPCKRGLRDSIKARHCGYHSVCKKRLEKAGCASSACGSVSTASKHEITSNAIPALERFCNVTVRSSVSSSGLTSTVVMISSTFDEASNCTRSAKNVALYCQSGCGAGWSVTDDGWASPSAQR